MPKTGRGRLLAFTAIELLLAAIATGDVDFLLCFKDIHLTRQTAADKLLPAAADVGVLNGWPILRRLLTGADIDEAREKGGYKDESDIEDARRIWHWCQREEVDLLQLAIQFCLREERIHGNPIGSLNEEQLEANILAAATALDDNVWAKFEGEFCGGR